MTRLIVQYEDRDRVFGFESHRKQVFVTLPDINLIDLYHKVSDDLFFVQTIDLQYEIIGASRKPFFTCLLPFVTACIFY